MALPSEVFTSNMPPGQAIRLLMEAKGWAQEDLAAVLGKSRQTVASIVSGKAGITPEMAVALGAASGNDPSDWLRLDGVYRLSLLEPGDEPERRARLYSKVPIREMQRRGWISDAGNVSALEAEVTRFLGVASLDETPTLSVATRRSGGGDSASLTPAQLAWCLRARQMAAVLQANKFDPAKLDRAERELRELAAYPKEARHLARVLGNYGIRLVIVEPIAGAKIDGAAFWLNADVPVIAISVRLDRVDHLWFVVMHEFMHIKNGDALSVDEELTTDDSGVVVAKNDAEDRANKQAAAALIEPSELLSFVRRIGPLYSTAKIIQFAHRMRIHPGIIVGQLHYGGHTHYRNHRDLLVKIRDVVTETTLTDGWGRSIAPDFL